MALLIALLAAFGAAVATGIATVLQKIGADAAERQHSIKLNFILKLLHNPVYLFGGFLSLSGWALSLLALHVLPLFAVQGIIASGLVVTAIAELIMLRTKIQSREWWAIAVVVGGLIILAAVAQPGRIGYVSPALRAIIGFGPLGILAAIAWALRLKQNYGATVLAILSGLAFSGTAIIGRIFVYPPSVWHLLINPLAWSLVIYAGLGLLAVTVALQRTLATSVNAISMTTQTIFPGLVGALGFGDAVRHGLWWVAIAATAMVVGGCMVMAQRPAKR